ncbi:MAG: gluconate 2-dehydrogenase subunit 3 family protein [Gemmatimonadales bacterium]
MDRRELLSWVSGFAASAALAPLAPGDRLLIAERLSRDPLADAFSATQAATVAALADAILPRTDTPGALDVEVPAFIAHMTANWYSADEAAELKRGLDAIDARATARFGRGLAGLAESDRAALLTELDGGRAEPASAEQAFGRIKSLTVYGYFTSKRIQAEVLETVIIPGRFDGCIPRPR